MQQEIDPEIDDIIAKILSDEATLEESDRLEDWKNEDPANAAYFSQMEKLWLMAYSVDPTIEQLDTEAALIAIKTKWTTPVKRGSGWISYLAYAASLAGILFLAQLGYQKFFHDIDPQVLVSVNEILVDTLKDGSKVTLNKKSGLTVMPGYNTKERRMRLEGEAFFEVAPDKTKPFIVEADQLQVQAVGTAFNIDIQADQDKITISVTEGKIKISGDQLEQYLIAGEKAEYTISTKALIKKNDKLILNELAYKSKMLKFEGTALSDVAASLKHAYDIELVFEPATLSDCILTAKYNDLPADRVVELIAESFSFQQVNMNNGRYILKGSGCTDE